MQVRRLASEERGAAAIEFALVFPVAAFLIFGLLYSLIAVAAQLSLVHAASRGVRYASIATDPLAGVYPSTADVAQHVASETPFFSASSCTTTVVGDSTENAPVNLNVACNFPNPLGRAVSALRNLILGGSGQDVYSDNLKMSAHAEARRE
jgi:Flp pilus assembly protein TadG